MISHVTYTHTVTFIIYCLTTTTVALSVFPSLSLSIFFSSLFNAGVSCLSVNYYLHSAPQCALLDFSGFDEYDLWCLTCQSHFEKHTHKQTTSQQQNPVFVFATRMHFLSNSSKVDNWTVSLTSLVAIRICHSQGAILWLTSAGFDILLSPSVFGSHLYTNNKNHNQSAYASIQEVWQALRAQNVLLWRCCSS